MTYIITQSCVDIMDRTCVDECPVDCIYEGARMLYIQPDECVECGACELVCPVSAIFLDTEVPVRLEPYIETNARFFDGLGSPGSASVLGPLGHDVEPVVNMPILSE
jgi:NAD-dependent dihydropyrimidine dehydrogenase PreA subunit